MRPRSAILVGLALCVSAWGWTQAAQAQRGVLASLEQDITSLVESVKPSLVTIETGSRAAAETGAKAGPSTFVGSGIIYSRDGYILTSASVVSGKKSFRITLPDGRALTGKLVGTDDESNLAVLKVDDGHLVPARLGNSDSIKVGSWLTVVGNSYGLPNAVALGLVNGLREDGFIQMSANVSPGNSGGPVLDTYGRVIGLVAAKLSEPTYISAVQVHNDKMATITIPSRQIEIPSSGISLALPINLAKSAADEIIRSGTVRRGYLGIYPQNLQVKLDASTEPRSGVMVAEIVKGSPAERAGLQSGDVIVKFGGAKVLDAEQIRKLIKSKRADEAVPVEVLRGDQTRELTVTLAAAKPSYSYIWDIPEAEPLPPTLQASQERAQEYARQVQDRAWGDRDEISVLQDKLQSLSAEVGRLSRELEKLKSEKGKE
jgi:S1-C subfamily serine protease